MSPLELFRAPQFDDPRTSRAASVLAPLLTLIAFAMALTTVSGLTIAWAQPWQIAGTFAATLLLAWTRWLVQKGRIQLAASLTTTILFSTSLSSLLADHTSAAYPAAFAISIAVGGITMRRPGPLWLGAGAALSIIVADFAARGDVIRLHRPVEEPAITIMQAIALVALGATIHWANRALDRARARAAEQEKRAVALQQTLLHAKKMEAIGRLAGGIAHDFNNVLTVVSGSAAVIAYAPELSPEDRDSCEAIIKAAESGAKLTRQLLAFGGKQLARPQILDVAGALADFEIVLEKMARRHDAKLNLRVSPGLGFVEVDPGQLQQAVGNLVVNAAHASEPGQKITIELWSETCDDSKTLSHGTLAAGEYVVLCVRDEGRGMDRETVSTALDPFFTTRRSRGGTGLGLAVVHGLVVGAGGQVEIRSELGRGTKVALWMPRREGPPTWQPKTKISYEGALAGRKVLVVDDDGPVRTAIRKQLESLGAAVQEAPSGPQALEIVAENPALDAIVVDVIMPDMSGPEVVQRLAAVGFTGSITLLTGYAEPDQIPSGVEERTRLIYKPPSTAALVDAVLRRAPAPPKPA